MVDVEAFVTLQSDQLGLEARSQDPGDFRLSHTGLTLEQQRALQLHRQINGGGQTAIRDVSLPLEQKLKLVDGTGYCLFQ
jgi:hypothetical protein